MAMSVFTILGLIVLAIAAAAVFRRIEALCPASRNSKRIFRDIQGWRALM